MNILIAPNAFKGSLTAHQAARAIQRGLLKSPLKCNCNLLPVADGGDGSLEVISEYLDASLLSLKVMGPLGAAVNAHFGWNSEQSLAVVEMAEASGLRLLSDHPQNPWRASSFGTGTLIMNALNIRANEIYLTIGGSATVDAGIGLLNAMGVKFFTKDRELLYPTIGQIVELQEIRVPEELSKVRIKILCDVDNPFLGENGAAKVFGPQKGITTSEIPKLEACFDHFVNVIERQFNRKVGHVKYGGAAGGVSAALNGILGAELISGGEKILQLAGFDNLLDEADLVITGEGKIDQQTKFGKAPGLVAATAAAKNIPVIGFSGILDETQIEPFDEVIAISSANQSLQSAMKNASSNLEQSSFQLGEKLALKS